MFLTKPKNKRAATASSSLVPSRASNVLNGLFACYNFVAPYECSEKTFGLLAFLLRSSVGEINFSHLIDEAEKYSQQGQTIDFAKLLDEKRMNLSTIEASIEKCLMLNRLISYIQNNGTEFICRLSDIRMDMRLKMTDTSKNQPITYPNDFRQREYDFNNRRNAQDVRRLFYLSHKEAKEPPSIIHLQNRITEQFSYLIECKMRYDSKFRDNGMQEIEKLFSNSFMIITQPRSGVTPVIVYERKGPGEYTAKISVIIVSLLHDFMQTHPNSIELYDIETSLWPTSPHYKLDESQTLSWKTCQIQISPDDKPQLIQYAELTFITILQSSKAYNRIHFADSLYTLKFAIKLQLNLPEYKMTKTYQIPLETASFAIASHNHHNSHMLTKVIIDDIRRFSRSPSIDIKVVLSYVLRYFKQRTGVVPYEFLRNYVEQELKRASNRRKNFQSLEDIFMDFLVPFVHQVEFMVKHPILLMFYADSLFLGICNSERAAEIMIHSSDEDSPIVGLRMNSIKIDYNAISTSAAANRPMKLYTCAVRVDIYNKRTKKLQYRTFDSGNLPADILKFVTTAHTEKANYIRILSTIDDKSDVKNYKLFTDFDKYYDDRLHEIYRTNEKYKPVTNLIYNVEHGDENDDESNRHGNESQNIDFADMLPENPLSIPPCFTPVSTHESTSDISSGAHVYTSIPSVQSDNIGSPSNQQSFQPLNNEELIRYAVSRPDILSEIFRQINIQQQVQMPYQNQQAFQMQSQYPQQTTFSLNQNHASQSQQLQNSPNLGSQWISQQNSSQVHILPMSEGILTQSTTKPIQRTTTSQTSSMSIDPDLLSFDEWFTSSN